MLIPRRLCSLCSSQGAEIIGRTPTPSPLNSVPTPANGCHRGGPPCRRVSSQSLTEKLEARRPRSLLRKEVIQPHVPVRLPCYDFIPIADPTFGSSSPQGVGPLTSGVADFRDVTGGVYKARERIHRDLADSRLLATPTSWSRVADSNPN